MLRMTAELSIHLTTSQRNAFRMTKRMRFLDYARDDSVAVNSLSTPLHFGRNDGCVGRHDIIRMRSLRLRCTSLRMTLWRGMTKRIRFLHVGRNDSMNARDDNVDEILTTTLRFAQDDNADEIPRLRSE